MVDSILGSPRVLWDSVPLITLTSAVYGAVLARAVVPLMAVVDQETRS